MIRPIAVLFVVMQLLLGAPLEALVDREHGLPAWYAPGVSSQAAAALDSLTRAAQDEGLSLSVYSDYRSYEEQADLFDRESQIVPDRAELYLALPGHSEHQLGTAFDVVWTGLRVEIPDARNERLYRWLEANAHRFGFVISYPYKKIGEWPYSNAFLPRVTEYIYEPWHIRYVGLELAEQIYSAGYLDPESPVLPQDFYRPWPPERAGE